MDEQQEQRNWELSKKHIFILSDSGKPIFSKHGDEQELVTTFGLLQAINSIVKDSGDTLRCINAGKRRIVYVVRESLIFVNISSTGEPEVVLCKQLEFAYSQILFILTSAVHNVLKVNASKDLRDLLGPDTTRLMNATCKNDITPENIAFEALKSIPIAPEVRSEVLNAMNNCVQESTAAAGLLLYDASLLAYVPNSNSGLTLQTSDIILLSSFIANSSALKSHDQNWVPLCLPEFNSKAYLQAYIANFTFSLMGSTTLSLVLISASSEGDMFKLLHSARSSLQARLSSKETSDALYKTLRDENLILNKYLKSYLVIHFFYKLNSTQKESQVMPAQYLSSSWNSSVYSSEKQESIWTQYYIHGVRMRSGSATPEASIFSTPTLEQITPDSLCSTEKSKTRQGSFIASSNFNNSPSLGDNICADPSNTHNLMVSPPSSNHSLVYTCTQEEIVVGLASAEAELHATFPFAMSQLDACNLANNLFRSLRVDAEILFQFSFN